MQLLDHGPRVEYTGLTVATLSVTPPADRSFLARRIIIQNSSVADIWTVVVGGREIMRLRIGQLGNNNADDAVFSITGNDTNLFEAMSLLSGQLVTVPVPQGQTMTVASVGGATADIVIIGEDHSPSDIVQSMVNHYQGSKLIIPVWGALGAAIAAAGDAPFVASTKPAYIPDIFSGVAFPVGWRATVLGLFADAAGVNTFSGAANHQSTSVVVKANKNGQPLFARDGNGLMSRGQGSSAGSANKVFGPGSTVYPPLQQAKRYAYHAIDPPLTVAGGDIFQWLMNIVGDVTGGADYSALTLLLIALFEQVS